MSVTYGSLGNMGRMGNAMFEIAASVGYGIKHNMPYVFPEWNGFKSFKYPFPIVQNTGFPIYREPHFHYTEIPKMENVDLFGYWQSKKYWEHCEDFIREIFEPTDVIKDSIIKLDGNTCALHIRRGDYLRLKDYHTNLPIEYYKEGMRLVGADRNIIFSDDIEWCKENFPDCEFVSTGDSMVDFFTMVQCKNFIMANSSWSWWASYLSLHQDKKIIAPKRWFAEKNAHAQTKDLYLPEWIVI